MKKLIIFAIMACTLAFTVSAQSIWVQNPVNCPNSYDGVGCGAKEVCGYLPPTQCNDNSLIAIPAVYNPTYQGQVSGTGFAAGYVLDCLAIDGSNPPYCDKWKCQVDAVCEGQDRVTNCSGVASASCGLCKSGYLNCTGDETTPCEIRIGESCTITASGLPGTCQACTPVTGKDTGGNDCNCVGAPVNFQTGVNAQYSTASPLLWGTQYGTGWLINMSNSTKMRFGVNGSGCVYFPDGTSQCTAGGGSGIWEDTGTQIELAPSASKALVFGNRSNATGQYSAVFGINNSLIGNYSLAFGTDNNISADYVYFFGRNNTPRRARDYQFVFGQDNMVDLYRNVVFGRLNEAFGSDCFIFGTRNKVVAGGTAFGTNNYAYGERALVGGHNCNATGDSFAAGADSQAHGEGCIAVGKSAYAGIAGLLSPAEGDAAFGYGTVANGSPSLATGYFTVASGLYSLAQGATTRAAGPYSVAMGKNAEVDSDVDGSFIWGASDCGASCQLSNGAIHDDMFAIHAGLCVSDENTACPGVDEGDVYVWGSVTQDNNDIAERIPQNGELEPGDIVVLDASNRITVKKSEKSYDTAVAGIISTEPGHILGGYNASRVEALVALAGRVPTKVTNEKGPIKIGDLLTTSSTPGHAMKCDDKVKCIGAIVGKAMEPHESGEGKIIALVTLQ